MDKFYDVNDFIVYLLRKWKTCIGIILITVILFAGNRAIGLLQDYKVQSNSSSKEQISQAENGEPMWIKVQKIIKIEPFYEKINGEEIDITAQVIEGYRTLGSSEEILDVMYDKWYEKEKAEDVNRKQNFNEYGYILDKEKNYPYTKYDFYRQLLLDGVEINVLSKNVGLNNTDENYITVGFKSTNEELARQIAEDYAASLTELVRAEVGEFAYELTNSSVLYELPERSEGTQTTRVIHQANASNNMSMSYIVKQTIKGIVWGGILGILIATIISFFMYMMTHKLYVLKDLKEYDLPILGVGFVKGSHKFRARFYSTLEGNRWDSTGYKRIIEKIDDQFSDELVEGEILVSGSGRKKYINQFVDELNKKAERKKYIYVKDVNDSWNIIRIAKTDSKKVLLVEEFGVSLKNEIEREIEILKEYKVEIIGLVGLE